MKLFIPLETACTPADVDARMAALAKTLANAGLSVDKISATLFGVASFAGAPVAPPGESTGYAGFLTVVLDSTAALDPAAVQRCCDAVGLPGALPCEERVHMSTDTVSTPATIVRFGFIERKVGLSPEEFRHHWLNRHSPLVMAHAPLFHRYAANLPMVGSRWDGIVEQWFVDEPTWVEHDRRIRESRPEVRVDIPRFVSGMAQYPAKPIHRTSVAGEERS